MTKYLWDILVFILFWAALVALTTPAPGQVETVPDPVCTCSPAIWVTCGGGETGVAHICPTPEPCPACECTRQGYDCWAADFNGDWVVGVSDQSHCGTLVPPDYVLPDPPPADPIAALPPAAQACYRMVQAWMGTNCGPE